MTNKERKPRKKKDCLNCDPKHCASCDYLIKKNIPAKIVKSIKKYVRGKEVSENAKKEIDMRLENIFKNPIDYSEYGYDTIQCAKCDQHSKTHKNQYAKEFKKYEKFLGKKLKYPEEFGKPIAYKPSYKREKKYVLPDVNELKDMQNKLKKEIKKEKDGKKNIFLSNLAESMVKIINETINLK
jgi:hypothetical protein